MGNPDPCRAAELSALLAKLYPAARPALVARAMAAAVKLARYAKRRGEIECCYPMTEENITRAAKRIARAAAKLDADIAAACNAGAPPDLRFDGAYMRAAAPRFTFGGDPRGACGMLHIPGQAGDGWGRDGFPLY